MHSIEQFQERVRAAAADKQPLRIRGGGTKDWYGQRLEGAILDTRGYTGIVDYEPTELVITARCGTPLAEIEAVLAERKQMLAFEPPHFGSVTSPCATLGGAIAAGLAGPRRASSGGVRDFVLGAKLLDGKGDVLSFGGQVMKNVAGYDVSRMLAGSLGTLGLLLEVSVKVLPRPFAETTLRLEMPEIDAIRRLNEWGGQPLPLSASCWHNGILSCRHLVTQHRRQQPAHRLAQLHGRREQRGGQAFLEQPAQRLGRRTARHLALDDAAADVHQVAVVDAARTGALAVAAGQAAVQVQLGLARGRLAFQHLLDQVDAPARAIELVAQQLVGGAGGRAEAAVHALAQDGFGFLAFGRVGELGRDLGLHVVSSARPSGGTDAPPRGAANEAGVGASAQRRIVVKVPAAAGRG
jgi:FAD/FMN-containing dehydrogenase